jgi:hypothetical protein
VVYNDIDCGSTKSSLVGLLHRNDDSGNVKIDWHDYKFMDYESKRIGPGEQGAAADQEIGALHFNGLFTNMISVNRSLPDIRPAG